MSSKYSKFNDEILGKKINGLYNQCKKMEDILTHKTKDFEVGTTIHPKGSEWPKHYHKKSREINYLIRGKMLIQDQEIVGGDVFVFEPYEVADPIFLEDCEVLVIKTPSVPGDKFECE